MFADIITKEHIFLDKRTKEMTFDLFRQVVWSDDDFMVIADYTPKWPQYTVYERCTMQSIGTTNCNYYMGQVRQIIHMHKKRMIQEFNV
jgi:hypothetical protein